MDQRGSLGPSEPTDTDIAPLERSHELGASAARLQAWARIAASRAVRHDLVPAQRDYAAIA
ncbi:hypothetical protein ACGIF2_10540 [Cellulomonas sp. P22]|uniref:hypothetical protein n=1 Tax=Cellulomonas sp. P22 TaxID=3373189 RepID=UPI0037B86119